MELSVKNLAAHLDTLDAGDAFVSEGETSITVSGLNVAAARDISDRCTELDWAVHIEDTAGTHWASTDLDEDFAPFRLTLEKPAPPTGVLRLLTDTGFAEWLEREDARADWQVAGLTSTFRCYAVTFGPWSEAPALPAIDEHARSARGLVREIAGQRSVPFSLSNWLIAHSGSFPESNCTAAVWMRCAARKLILALPDEFDSEAQSLRFKGPPRLDLKLPAAGVDLESGLGHKGFLALQAALDWTFEIEREAEMRHILLATELARSGGTSNTADLFVKENIADALASAKLAYQMQLAGMSSDVLKTLSELRKTVSDDTAKVADGTRQIIAAVAGALAIGAGLIAARLTGSVNPALVNIVMALAATYVAITIISGVLFSLLQRSVRKAWQPRLYRFLTEADYKSLVGKPARTAEIALWACSALGVVAIILMTLAIVRTEPQQSATVDTQAAASDAPAPPPLPPSSLDDARRNSPAPETSSAIASDAARETDNKKAAPR